MKKVIKKIVKKEIYLAFFLSLLLIGCALTGGKSGDKKAQIIVYYGHAVVNPTAVPNPTEPSQVKGQVWFSEAFGKVKVEADFTGLDANSQHGIHIHEYGDCTAPDGASAGGHYNPGERQHGSHESEDRHIGDLGNLMSDKKGRAKLEIEIPNMSINGALNPIVGRAVIVHKNPDDLISQPSGGAGARLACGVIGAAKR